MHHCSRYTSHFTNYVFNPLDAFGEFFVGMGLVAYMNYVYNFNGLWEAKEEGLRPCRGLCPRSPLQGALSNFAATQYENAAQALSTK